MRVRLVATVPFVYLTLARRLRRAPLQGLAHRRFARYVLTLVAVALLAAPAAGAVGQTGLQERATKDRPDQVGPFQIHALYFVPSDGNDRRLDRGALLHTAVQRGQAWLARQTGGEFWRTDTYGPKRLLDVTFVRGQKRNSDYVEHGSGIALTLEEELAERGFDLRATRKRYLVFYDGEARRTGLCGSATYPVYGPSGYAPTGDGQPKFGGPVAVVLLRSDPACHMSDIGTDAAPGWLPTTIMHELTHLEGLVAPGALHTCSPAVFLNAHVCGIPTTVNLRDTEPFDPEREDLLYPLINLPLKDKSLDAGHDDYYRSQALLDLADSAFLVSSADSSSRVRSRFAEGTIQRQYRVVEHGDVAHVAH